MKVSTQQRHARELERGSTHKATSRWKDGSSPSGGTRLHLRSIQASMDVHDLLEQAASKAAASTWQIAGARQEDESAATYSASGAASAWRRY